MSIPLRTRHTNTETIRSLDDLADLYDEVYAEPPYNSSPIFARSEFLRRTAAQAQSPGFTLITAEGDDGLVGFSLGLSFGTNWWRGEFTPPPDELAGATRFAVIELLVRQRFRGVGTGRDLLNDLLSGRPEDYAMLTSVPEAPAHSMYQHWGWRKIGAASPTERGPMMEVMALPLPSGRPAPDGSATPEDPPGLGLQHQ
jgi:GNAT superfamily N-acetyltransferase